MKKFLLLLFVIFSSIAVFAQLEVKQGSFKEVPGFVNINTDKMYDDNDKPYAVLKIRTENINDKQRRELNFGGDAQTFFEVEYKDGEVWLYISYYASFIKISHNDLSSTEFYFPFDMEPKKGYELTLINKPSVDEEILRRIENLEKSVAVAAEQTNKQNSIPPKQPQGTSVSVKNHNAFSVSSNKTVCFSKGNLQYNDTTNTWRFAKHQWDIAEGGWRDLFEWSYSGIKKWYILSKDEWEFVIYKRETRSGIRFAKAVVNGVNGIVLLPDNWKRIFAMVKNANDGGALYSSNKISQLEWESKFEANGAVFLPATGYHQGHDFRVGTAGRYWSSTEKTDVDAYYVGFTTNELDITYSDKYKYGFSIRLVCDVE